MHLAWAVAAQQTKVNKPGLVFAAIFVVVAVILVLRASRLERRRSKRAAEYARADEIAGPAAAPLPTHAWQAIAHPDLSSLFALPNEAVAAQMPAFARFVVHQAERTNSVENARSTAVANTTLVVFDHLEEHLDGDHSGVERSVCGRFGLDFNSPWLDINANVGLGTFAVGASGIQLFKFEFDDFNQAFSVVGADQKLAFSLFDGEMMRWFLAHPHLRSLQLRGADALAKFTAENSATDADAVFAFVSGFLSRIAPLVRHEWPGPRR